MRSSRSNVIFGLLLACAGCIPYWIPTPLHGLSGKVLDKDAIRFIRLGTTSRDEVLLRLGAPTSYSSDEEWFGYEADFRLGYWGLATFGGEGVHEPVRKRSYVRIHFDNAGRVRSVESNVR